MEGAKKDGAENTARSKTTFSFQLEINCTFETFKN